MKNKNEEYENVENGDEYFKRCGKNGLEVVWFKRGYEVGIMNRFEMVWN